VPGPRGLCFSGASCLRRRQIKPRNTRVRNFLLRACLWPAWTAVPPQHLFFHRPSSTPLYHYLSLLLPCKSPLFRDREVKTHSWIARFPLFGCSLFFPTLSPSRLGSRRIVLFEHSNSFLLARLSASVRQARPRLKPNLSPVCPLPNVIGS